MRLAVSLLTLAVAFPATAQVVTPEMRRGLDDRLRYYAQKCRDVPDEDGMRVYCLNRMEQLFYEGKLRIPRTGGST